MGTPRSESGKYWKEQYETYAKASEKQMKQLVAKHQVAKNYAKKKDDEAMEAATRLAEERKRHRNRERELEQQNKDYQERLRQALAEKTAASVEISALKSRIAALEKSASSEVQNSKMSFQIYEDLNKDSSHLRLEQDNPFESRPRVALEPASIILGNAIQSSQKLPDKENSPPKRRHTRRQTISGSPSRPHPSQSHSTIEASELANQPYRPQASLHPTQPSQTHDLPPKSPLSIRRQQASKENLPPKSPIAPILSSPLPLPSPDPWMADVNESPAPAFSRLDFPISSGTGYSRPSKPMASRHRAAKSVVRAPNTNTGHENNRKTDADAAKSEAVRSEVVRSEVLKSSSQDAQTEESRAISHVITENTAPTPTPRPTKIESKIEQHKSVISHQTSSASASNVEKSASEKAEDRKEKAKRRLAERQQRRLAA